MKKLTPYRSAAAAALVNWNGKSPEEAKAIVETKTYEEVEQQTYASGSVAQAVEFVMDYLKDDLTAEELEQFHNAVMKTDDAFLTEEDTKILQKVGTLICQKGDPHDLLLNILSAIHDHWVETSHKKFVDPKRESKMYQHLPLQMIGWKEATADLMFVAPIFKACGIDIDNTKLKNMYANDVIDYFRYNNITSSQGRLKLMDLAVHILKVDYEPRNKANSHPDKDQALIIANQVKEAVKDIVCNKQF